MRISWLHVLTEIHCTGESIKAMGHGDGAWSMWGWPGSGDDLGYGAEGRGCIWGHTAGHKEEV